MMPTGAMMPSRPIVPTLPFIEAVTMATMVTNPWCIRWMAAVVPGTPIVAVGTRDCRDLTSGKVYAACNGREDGIFESRPFVTVVADDGKKHSFHLSRFERVGPVVGRHVV
jgi:hypothetical protein